MLVIKILSTLAFIGSTAWFITQRDYEPAIAAITSLATLIGSFYVSHKRKPDASQEQHVGAGGFGIQAGRDVQINQTTKDQ